jgi:hypothetical protein
LRAALKISAALAAALFGICNLAAATPIDLSDALSHSSVSSKRSMEPLIDYLLFPWPYAYVHQIDRVDRFTNTSPDTLVTITQASALTLDPEALGFANLTTANRDDVERAAASTYPAASFWDVEDLPFETYRAGWTPKDVAPEDELGGPLSFPLTLAPQQSVLLHTSAFTVGAFEGLGEMVIGWTFEGMQTGGTPPLSGDVNRDGRVDLADFGVLKTNFGVANASWSQGDLNGDGHVSLEDFGRFKDSFGKSASAVPEPSSAWLVIGGALGIVGLWHRSRRARGHGWSRA